MYDVWATMQFFDEADPLVSLKHSLRIEQCCIQAEVESGATTEVGIDVQFGTGSVFVADPRGRFPVIGLYAIPGHIPRSEIASVPLDCADCGPYPPYASRFGTAYRNHVYYEGGWGIRHLQPGPYTIFVLEGGVDYPPPTLRFIKKITVQPGEEIKVDMPLQEDPE